MKITVFEKNTGHRSAQISYVKSNDWKQSGIEDEEHTVHTKRSSGSKSNYHKYVFAITKQCEQLHNDILMIQLSWAQIITESYDKILKTYSHTAT